MPKTEVYQITSLVPEQQRDELNRILYRIADRLDKLEGIRGSSTIQDGLFISDGEDVVHGFNTDDELS